MLLEKAWGMPCLTPCFSLSLPCPQECGSQHSVQQRALWSLELYFYLILFNYYLHEQVGTPLTPATGTPWNRE